MAMNEEGPDVWIPPAPHVYVAGAYTSETITQEMMNVARARVVARLVVGLGAWPVCPHLVGDLAGELHPYDWWMRVTGEQLRACVAMVIVPHSSRSRGTLQEEAVALAMGIPIIRATRCQGDIAIPAMGVEVIRALVAGS